MLVNPSLSVRSSLLSCRIQPAFFAPSTTSTTTLSSQQRRLKSSTPLTTLSNAHPQPNLLTRSTSTSTTVPSNPDPQTLNWNAYLTLRRTRRRLNLLASLSTALTTTTIGSYLLSQQDLDALAAQVGLDPFMVLGLTTAGVGALGWLCGPVVGNAVFGLWYRKWGREIAAKEKDFYHRIKRYRVDPSSQSFSNPVPDYYGEKIGSVRDFRHWLKDQRAYNRKKRDFL
ncbi:TIM23 complex component [Toensbergia leucococca]|nr:TIM23 complex component [Toensbergia leucococca]